MRNRPAAGLSALNRTTVVRIHVPQPIREVRDTANPSGCKPDVSDSARFDSVASHQLWKVGSMVRQRFAKPPSSKDGLQVRVLHFPPNRYKRTGGATTAQGFHTPKVAGLSPALSTNHVEKQCPSSLMAERRIYAPDKRPISAWWGFESLGGYQSANNALLVKRLNQMRGSHFSFRRRSSAHKLHRRMSVQLVGGTS